MKHALGFPDPRASRKVAPGWRNRYVVSVGHFAIPTWKGLVSRGLATAHPNDDGTTCYCVTREGCELLGMQPDEVIEAAGTQAERADLESRRQKKLIRQARRRR